MTSTAHKILDWRLPFCVALLGLVLYIILTGLGDARESREKSVRIDALIEQNDRQQATAERERALAAEERAAASAERQRLLKGQERLERQYQRLVKQQVSLLEYLRSQGVEVPDQFTRTYVIQGQQPRSSAPRSLQRDGASSPPKAGPGRSSHHASPKARGKKHR